MTPVEELLAAVAVLRRTATGERDLLVASVIAEVAGQHVHIGDREVSLWETPWMRPHVDMQPVIRLAREINRSAALIVDSGRPPEEFDATPAPGFACGRGLGRRKEN